MKDEDKQADHKRIAKALIAKGKGDQAVEHTQPAVLDANPDDADTRLARAILFRESHDPKKLDLAITELNTLLKANPNDEIVRYNLGLTYLSKQDAKSAHGQFIESARLRRDYLPPRSALAEMALKERAYAETIRIDTDEILAVDPANADARLWHAAGLIERKVLPQQGAERN